MRENILIKGISHSGAVSTLLSLNFHPHTLTLGSPSTLELGRLRAPLLYLCLALLASALQQGQIELCHTIPHASWLLWRGLIGEFVSFGVLTLLLLPHSSGSLDKVAAALPSPHKEATDTGFYSPCKDGVQARSSHPAALQPGVELGLMAWGFFPPSPRQCWSSTARAAEKEPSKERAPKWKATK